MKISVKPGTYVVAVSGGVDSVVLLDLLNKQPKLRLIVAHFDHGIREDSAGDAEFVKNLAKASGLTFKLGQGELGSKASEDVARRARYEFLFDVETRHKADAIITAHHQDDVIETIIINLIRGTGRKGLSSLSSRDNVIRPLLNTSKADLITYARANNLTWHEDSTNADTNYLRNWIRHHVTPKLTPTQRAHLLKIQEYSLKNSLELDSLLDRFIGSNNVLDRHMLIMLPHTVAKEVIAHWLRKNGIADFDSKMLEKIAVDAKTYVAGKKTAIKKGAYALYSKTDITLKKQ